MMKKLCLGLVKGTMGARCQPLVNQFVVSFASSKQQKSNKNLQNNKVQTPKNQMLKSPTNIQNIKQSARINSKQKSQSKSIMTEQQKKELALLQKLQATYAQLQSLPSDSYQTIVENFKRVKGKLNDRKVYIPNKPQLLAKLDNSMELVKKHHEIWKSPSTAPQRKLTDSKSQIIEWELQQAKKKYYLSLLDNEKVLIGIAGGFVLFFAGIEYFHFVREEQDDSKKIPKQYL